MSANLSHVKSYAKKLPFNGLPGNRTNGFFVWDPNRPGQLMYVGGLVEGERIGLDEVWAPRWTGLYTDLNKITEDARVYNAFLPYTNKRIKQLGDARWHQVNKNDTIDSVNLLKWEELLHSMLVVFHLPGVCADLDYTQDLIMHLDL